MRRALPFLAATLATALAQAVPAQDGVAALDPPALVSTRAIRAGETIGPGDVALGAAPAFGAVTDPADAVGLEARQTIYRGHPVIAANLAPPALVERNQIVTMTYAHGALTITAEGRALERAGAGEKLRVMNLDSRMTVTAIVSGPGQVEVRR
ncbi:MAG: flagellar basal body P-ring formation chaperone FlgA [Rubrimonas sp.]|uniref:flagellar basal body P-ring formation chaperone FlgA n=1 Tax=Rubrimonas sp. TaxID=2036015 RepID=UPI002FDE1A7D